MVFEHQPQAIAADVETVAGARAARGDRAKLPHSTAAGAASERSVQADSLIGITAEQAIARGILCAGNPDTVYRQIMDIYDKVGGFANFIFVGRSGFLDHQEAEKGIRLMAKEVIPRLPAPRRPPNRPAKPRSN